MKTATRSDCEYHRQQAGAVAPCLACLLRSLGTRGAPVEGLVLRLGKRKRTAAFSEGSLSFFGSSLYSSMSDVSRPPQVSAPSPNAEFSGKGFTNEEQDRKALELEYFQQFGREMPTPKKTPSRSAPKKTSEKKDPASAPVDVVTTGPTAHPMVQRFSTSVDEERAALELAYFQEHGRLMPKSMRQKGLEEKSGGFLFKVSSDFTTLRATTLIPSSIRVFKRDIRTDLGKLLDEPGSSRGAKAILVVVIIAIVVSVLVFYLSTVKALTEHDGGQTLWVFEAICVFIFTVEVGVRSFVGTLDPKRLLLCDVYYWVDILSIIPFYLELIVRAQPDTCTIGGIAVNDTSDLGSGPVVCVPAQLPQGIAFMQLLRLMRILKLMRHYVDMRVLILAVSTAWRALLVPGFAMLMIILVLSGALWLLEADPSSEVAFEDGFASLWCIFWIVSTLGFDGPMGSGGAPGKMIIAIAIISGLILTTMPITVMGEAFHGAWKRKELIILQEKMADLLALRGISVQDFKSIFDELDTDGSGELDWNEFKNALSGLGIRLPIQKVRNLFEALDDDRQGSVSQYELCKALFPTLDWEKLREEEEEQKRAAIAVQSRIRGFLARKKSCNVTSLSELAGINLGSENELYADMELTSLQKAESLGRLSSQNKAPGLPMAQLVSVLPAPARSSPPDAASMAALLDKQSGQIAALEKSVRRVSEIAEQLLLASNARKEEEKSMKRLFAIAEQLMEDSMARRAEHSSPKGAKSRTQSFL